MAGKESIVIKKVKKGGHGAAHGGAWKVAYADFVTAMMCFFLVMWLMGSDDETKSAISHYFNNPSTPWKAGSDPASTSVHPMGESEGSGESVMNGLDGFLPDDMVKRVQPAKNIMHQARTIARMLEDLLEGKIYGFDQNEKRVRFSLPEIILFREGSAELTVEAQANLDVLGQLLRDFNGYLSIEGYTNEKVVRGGKYTSNWDLSFARAMSVMNYLVKHHKMDEKKIFPVAGGARRGLASSSKGAPANVDKDRRVEFILSYEEPEFSR